MVKKESTKGKRDKEFYSEAHSKSPDRSGSHTVAGYYAHSHQNSIIQKSPYIHNNLVNTTNGSDYNGSNKKRQTATVNMDK